ncbi:MAG: DUF3185 family protein [Phycisphaeraceae bacterium]|nr:DUF3185 family protein [Phycisphaeraceae bacterium]
MKAQHIFGILLLIVGVVLFIIGLNASDSLADQTSSFFTGHYTDRTVWYMVGGGLLALGGLAVVIFGGAWRRT